MAEAMNKYNEYLEKKNEESTANHSLPKPVDIFDTIWNIIVKYL